MVNKILMLIIKQGPMVNQWSRKIGLETLEIHCVQLINQCLVGIL